MQVGILPSEAQIPVGLILFKELDISGSFRFGPVYADVLEACASGSIRAADVVNKTFSFDELPQALRYASEGDGVLKVQVQM